MFSVRTENLLLIICYDAKKKLYTKILIVLNSNPGIYKKNLLR